jgi:hypothetical protein
MMEEEADYSLHFGDHAQIETFEATDDNKYDTAESTTNLTQ